jgi:hypothetical protein
MARYIQYKKGEKIGNLIYIRDVVSLTNRRAEFICPFCNNKFTTAIGNAKTEHTRSCGCQRANKGAKTHGLSQHPLFKLWIAIRQRCCDPNHSCYHNYGGRGILICAEWRYDFLPFFNYVRRLDNYGKSNFTLDRVNNNGNYEPGNLRWSSIHVQNANSRVQKNNKTGFSGVCLNRGLYHSYIYLNRKQIRLGTYETATEAAKARNNFILSNELWEYPLAEI